MSKEKMSAAWEQDAEIQSWLDNHPSVSKIEWNKKRINGTNREDNPFIDKRAVLARENAQYKDHPTLKMTVENCSKYNEEKVEIRPPTYIQKNQIYFRSDFKTIRSDKGPTYNMSINSPSALFYSDAKAYSPLQFDFNFTEGLPKSRFLEVNVSNITIPFAPIEPVLCSAFIFSPESKTIISETWYFWTPTFSEFFETSPNLHGAFDLEGSSPNSYLIIIFNRVMQADADTVNNYYRKQTDSALGKAKQSIAATWPKLKEVQSQFAFTFLTLENVKDGEIEFPSPFLLEKPFTAESAPNILEKALNKKFDPIPFKLTADVEYKEVVLLSEFEDNRKILLNVLPYTPKPLLQYRHQMILNLASAKFDLPSKVNARNIVASVSIQVGENGEPIKAIQPRWWSSDLCETVYSRCQYHEKSPVFEEEFLIDLPFPMDEETMVVIKFYHAATQEKEPPLKYFGSASFTLLTKDGHTIIPDGPVSIGISYSDKPDPSVKVTGNNYINLKTRLRSNLMSTDKNVSDFLNPPFDTLPKLQNFSDVSIMNFLYQYLDYYLNDFPNHPEECFENITSLGHLIKSLPKIQVETYFDTYVTQFAFRTRPDPQIIKSILKACAARLPNLKFEPNVVLDEIAFAPYLLKLIAKCIVVTQSRDFEEEMNLFSKNFGRKIPTISIVGVVQQRRITTAYAHFVNVLIDQGLYTAAGKCIIDYSWGFPNNSTDHDLLVTFLSQTLHPKLILGLSLAQQTFVQYFKELITFALKNSSSVPLQAIFKQLCRGLSFIPPENYSDFANNFISLIECFSADMKTSELKQALVFIIFILKHVKPDAFKKFVAKAKRERFFGFLHFILVKSKYSEQEEQDSKNSVQKEDEINAIKTSLEKQSLASAPESPNPANARKRQFAQRMQNSPVKAFSHFSTVSKPTSLEGVNTSREIALDAQYAMIHVLTILLNFNAAIGKHVLEMIFHLLSMNLAIDVFSQIKDLIFLFIEKHSRLLIENNEPPYSLFAKKLLSLAAAGNDYVADTMVSIFPRIYAAEKRLYPTLNRSLVSSIRAISLLKPEEVASPKLLNALRKRTDNGGNIDRMAECVENLAAINKELLEIDGEHFSRMSKAATETQANPNVDIEKYSDDLFERSKILALSPDAAIEQLQLLSAYNFKCGYVSEALMTQMYQIALIIEYLTVLKRMPNLYNMEHPCLAFEPFCIQVKDAVCPQEIMDDIPDIPTFCDSLLFNEAGVFTVLQEIITLAKQSNIFELANEVIRATYPILERHHQFFQLSRMFRQTEMAYNAIKLMSSSLERLFGRYYRVGFYGSVFGKDDGKMFIYREIKLAHIYEVSAKLRERYEKMYGVGKIEMYQGNGMVDRRLLNPDKGYLQITSVEPYFEKSEKAQRVTVFERGFKISQFSFETPFIKGNEKKLQGNVDQQWLRRVIIRVKAAMPSITKRVEVQEDGIKIIEYEPIRVSITALKERLQTIEDALKTKDMQVIQPLLHGNLLVSVNEGPARIAEVFLGTTFRTKYTEKMRGLFKRFVELNRQGLEIHGNIVKTQRPEFAELQEAMEDGFDSLQKKLEPYLNTSQTH